MKNKLLPLSITFVFIIIFIIFFKGLQNTNIYTPETKTIYEVPSVSVKLFNSNEIVNTLEIFNSDKFYLLNIWSSWCVPCRKEHPILMELKNNNKIEQFKNSSNYKISERNKKFLEIINKPLEKFDDLKTKNFQVGQIEIEAFEKEVLEFINESKKEFSEND